MDTFFSGIDPEVALELAELSRRAFDLREQRKQILREAGFEEPAELLEAVREERVDARAGYDVWLTLALLQEQQESIRAWVDWRCRGSAANEPAPASWADILAERPLPEPFDSAVTVHSDGLSFALGDLSIVARIVATNEWSVEWTVRQRRWRLDTAPARPAHIDTVACLRRPDGAQAADPWRLGSEAGRVETLQRLLEHITATPEP